MRTGLSIPREVWLLIYEYMWSSDHNPIMFMELSAISRSARDVFLSDAVWKYLNPYNVTGIYKFFIQGIQFLNSTQKQNLYEVWSYARLDYYNTKPLVDTPAYKLQKKTLPSVGEGENLYYDLGLVLATDHLVGWYDIVCTEIDNRQLLWCAMKINYRNYLRASERLSKDIDLVKLMLKEQGESIGNIKVPITEELALLACQNGGLAIRQFQLEQYTENRKVAAAAIANDPGAIEDVSPALLADEEFLRQLIPVQGNVLAVAPERLKKDRELVKKAVLSSGSAMEHVLPEMKKDRELWLIAVTSSMFALDVAPEWVRDDKEIVLKAIESHASCFTRASERLKKDIDVIRLAVYYDGSRLGIAPDSIKKDRDLIMKGLQSSRYSGALQYVPEYANDREIVKACVKSNGGALRFASKELQADREIVKLAVTRNGYALDSAADKFKDDEEIVHLALASDGDALQYASERLRDDYNTVSIAVNRMGDAIKFASYRLQNDPDIQLRARVSVMPMEEDDDVLYGGFNDPYLEMVNAFNARRGLGQIDVDEFGEPIEKVQITI